MTMLTPPSELLAACPKFRILVLGNPESTKQELFTKVFGVDLEKKLVDDSFSPNHDINQELNLHGQNARLAIHTCLNLGAGDDSFYDRVRDFLVSRAAPFTQQEDRIHCIWYCVASEEGRSVTELEKRFFSAGLPSAAPGVPLVLVFTKYDEFVEGVRLGWSVGAEQRGLSKVAVSHILGDLASKRFEEQIGAKWDAVLKGTVPRVCVSSGDEEADERRFEELAEATLERLRDKSVRYAFAAAQRNSALISTRFAADTAANYFEVDTGHARKLHGIDMRDILPNFLSKATQLFNLRDPDATLTASPDLLTRILDATFDASRKPLLTECLNQSGTESGTMLLHLTPHERAVLLTQALAATLLFLHRLAGTQWPHKASHTTSYLLTPALITRQLENIQQGRGRRVLLATVEASTVFTACPLKSGVADLIVRAVVRADETRMVGEGHWHAGTWLRNEPSSSSSSSRAIMVEDGPGREREEISLSFVNDKGPDHVVLPCGLTILPLT